MQGNSLKGRVAALVVGFVVGFFIVLNSIFSDVFTFKERLYSFLLVILFYGVIGLVFSLVSPSWKWGLWLAAPAVLLVIFYSISDGFRPLLYISYIVLTIVCACGGAYLGAKIRKK